MTSDPLAAQSRRLEDLFFLKEDQKLIERRREIEKMKLSLEALKEVSGIHNEGVLRRLMDLEIDPKTISCLSLFPLVATAWADGSVDEAERKAVLAAASDSGVRPGSVEYAILESWVQRRPSAQLFEAWMVYVRGLCEKLSSEERALLRADIMGQARAVAQASGGFLGLGSKVSEKEEGVLKKLDGAFGPA